MSRLLRWHRAHLELLEDRTLPAAIFWNVDADGFWDEARNWRDDQGVSRLPGPNDDVFIDRPTTAVVVTQRTSAPVRSLISHEALVLTIGGSLAPARASELHGPFTLSGGTRAGAGTLTILDQFTWTGGFLEGPATTVISGEATLRVGGELLIKRLATGHVLSIAGTMDFTGAQVNLEILGTLNIQPKALLRVDVQNLVRFLPGGQSGIFNNAGSVEVLRGALEFGARFGSSNGTFHAAAGTRIALPQPHNFTEGTAFTGLGLKILSGAVTLNGAIAGENVQLSGTLTGTHTLTGSFTWLSGSFTAPGTTTLAADSTFIISGVGTSHALDARHVFHNAGVVILTDGNELRLTGTGTAFVNADSGLLWSSGNNLLASVAGGTFANLGQLQVQTGTLNLMLDGGLGNAGTVLVEADGVLVVDGPYVQTTGRTRLSGGRLTAAFIDLQEGLLEGTGSVVGDVFNAGRIEVGRANEAGVLNLYGSYTQFGTGILSMEIGGLEPGSQYDHLYIEGLATLDGTLSISLLNEFLPEPDDTFRILNFGSASGDFAALEGLAIGEDRAFVPFTDETGYVLRTILI